MSDNGSQHAIIEALILASPEPLATRKITEVCEDMTLSQVTTAVAELNIRYMEMGASFRIREIAGGYQFYITPEFTGYVDDLLTRHRKLRLTRAALETLAIIAYRQPVTKTDIEHIRGVASDGVVQNLLEKKLITIKGRADSPGRALQYASTDEFLKMFGLNSLEDLPQMSEIEELLASRSNGNDDELKLGLGNEDNPIRRKLNVADGTYDPDQVNEEPLDVEINVDDAVDAHDEQEAEILEITDEVTVVHSGTSVK